MQNKDNLNENLKIEQSNKGGFTMKITSTAFNDNESIPKKFTCQGDKINPGLEISDVPNGTKSLALIMDDPDAPFGTYIHWLVKDISPQTKTIGENSIPGTEFINSGGSPSYVPPCPPSGIHSFFQDLCA
jgi:Raf kinase inhibitor-like YbhB/YbcL family protein